MSVVAQRNHVAPLTRGVGSNLGLYFYRNVEAVDEVEDRGINQGRFLNSLVDITLDSRLTEVYGNALETWKNAIKDDGQVDIMEFITTSPLLCGMGNHNTLEVGATLMHPYGMPYIPGATIKGIVSSYAERVGGSAWKKTNAGKRDGDGGSASIALFGGIRKKESFAGGVDFLDAWWEPSRRDENKSPFALDILTPHQINYYRREGADDSYPDGTDSPVPHTFLVLKPGLSFLFAIRGPEALRKIVKEILKDALSNAGLGGKTRAGYGRFRFVPGAQDIIEEISTIKDPGMLKEKFPYVANPDPEIAKAVRMALERNNISYSDDLDWQFKKAWPEKWLLERFKGTTPRSYQEANTLFKEVRRDIDLSDKSDSIIQDIFRICYAGFPKEIQNWVKDIAPTWDDLFAGKDVDAVNKVLESPPAWLDLVNSSAAIDRTTLSPDDKEFLKEMHNI